MTRILFVCHGNICRSPMAEYIMKDLVRKAGREDDFIIASAATSTEEIGHGVYPPARQKLAEHGISCRGHAARQMCRSDYADYDLLVGMDCANLRNMRRIAAAIRTGRSTFYWSLHSAPARKWQIPGIPMILRRPGRIFWRAVRPFCKS